MSGSDREVKERVSKRKTDSIEQKLAEKIAENRRSMVRITVTLERARAIKVGVKAAGEELEQLVRSLAEDKSVDADRIEELVQQILTSKESSTPH